MGYYRHLFPGNLNARTIGRTTKVFEKPGTRAQAGGDDRYSWLTKAVVKETSVAIAAHELIKVRVLGDDRDGREAWFQELCSQLDAAPVQHIGKLLVLYRPAKKARIRLP
jgi:RNA-binding protein YhbY